MTKLTKESNLKDLFNWSKEGLSKLGEVSPNDVAKGVSGALETAKNKAAKASEDLKAKKVAKAEKRKANCKCTCTCDACKYCEMKADAAEDKAEAEENDEE